MDTAQISRATLADFYRFALLLTGDRTAAETALAEALSECDAQLGQLRSPASRHACLAMRVRACCTRVSSAGESSREASAPEELGRRFYALPEPSRSAMALFYLDLFTCKEIADLLRLDLPALATALGSARAQLQQTPAAFFP